MIYFRFMLFYRFLKPYWWHKKKSRFFEFNWFMNIRFLKFDWFMVVFSFRRKFRISNRFMINYWFVIFWFRRFMDNDWLVIFRFLKP